MGKCRFGIRESHTSLKRSQRHARTQLLIGEIAIELRQALKDVVDGGNGEVIRDWIGIDIPNRFQRMRQRV
ncbi:hypothetical protein D3C80_1832550 [compost metagenome]